MGYPSPLSGAGWGVGTLAGGGRYLGRGGGVGTLARGLGTLGYPLPLPPVNRQTPVKTVPYRRTTYAVGTYSDFDQAFKKCI